MVATPVTKALPYYAGGVAKVYWLSALADADLVPTRAELDAGTDLTPSLEAVSGWTESTAFTDVYTLDSRRGTKIAGRISIADSSLTFTTDKSADNNVEDELSWDLDDDGFIVMLDHGDVAATPCRVFAVTVGSISKDVSGDHTITVVSFGIRNSAVRVPVPAAA